MVMKSSDINGRSITASINMMELLLLLPPHEDSLNAPNLLVDQEDQYENRYGDGKPNKG
jgi:hypothetical protein